MGGWRNGRRARFRTWWGNPWRFESSPAHSARLAQWQSIAFTQRGSEVRSLERAQNKKRLQAFFVLCIVCAAEGNRPQINFLPEIFRGPASSRFSTKNRGLRLSIPFREQSSLLARVSLRFACVPRKGIEPLTPASSGLRSATELPRHFYC